MIQIVFLSSFINVTCMLTTGNKLKYFIQYLRDPSLMLMFWFSSWWFYKTYVELVLFLDLSTIETYLVFTLISLNLNHQLKYWKVFNQVFRSINIDNCQSINDRTNPFKKQNGGQYGGAQGWKKNLVPLTQLSFFADF